MAHLVTDAAQQEMAIVDGVLMPAVEATIPITDEGFLRGDSVFDAFRVYGGQPFGVAEHLARLGRSAAGMRLDGVDFAAIEREIGELIAARGADEDYGLRVVCTRGGRRILITESVKVFPPSIGLASVNYRPNIVLDGLKTLSYGGNVQANRLAKEKGFDEALLVTPEGHVLEGPTAAIFWSPDGEQLVTPPLDVGILDSITRTVLIDSLAVEVRPTTLEEVLAAKEAFLCSSVREVQPIDRIDDHEMAVPGPRTSAAKQALDGAVQARLAGAAANNV
ncbi:MAG: aminotransferase class IV [Solirubrobacterales bacterium]